MINKIISEGNKVELQRMASLAQSRRGILDEEVKTYYSLVTEVIDEDRVKITMPLEKGRIVPLSLNARYNVSFYTENGLYQARAIVTDRFKEDNIYMLIIEIVSDLVKFQRRQYYRLGCTMDMYYKKIDEEEEEQEYGDIRENEEIGQDELYIDGTALDISGGGMRFVSDEQLNVGDDIFVVISIQYENESKTYGLNAKVIMSNPMPKRKEKYEHRVEYKNIDGKVRESLIKYIFDEERRQRKRENDNR